MQSERNKMPATRFAAGVEKRETGLLGEGLLGVAGFEVRAGNRCADGRDGVDIGSADGAYGCGKAAQDVAGCRVLDLFGDAADFKSIAHLDAGIPADVEDDLTAIDRGDDAFDDDGADADFGR